MTDFSQLLSPEWTLSNLINLRPGWQANISDEEFVAVGTGETIEEAITTAQAKADAGQVVGRLFHLERLRLPEAERVEGRSLLAQLGLLPKVVRRL